MNDSSSAHERWARFRFQVVGPLLASPPEEGDLRRALKELSERTWKHPIDAQRFFRCGYSTIERWYYTAKESPNPIEALRRKVRKDAGTWKIFAKDLVEVLEGQYRDFPSWSFQLHYDNLAVLVDEQSDLGQLPAYPTLVRYMRAHGMRRKKRRGNNSRPGLHKADDRLERRETRSFEVDYVSALWHLDFHESKFISIVDRNGERVVPQLLAILDDHSRLCCHAQFYLHEDTDCLVHGFSQALLKRGLCRDLLSDNGSAMISGEFTKGLERFSITHDTTLPYSPHQNGKQEFFWSVVEGRFLAMLEKFEGLTLNLLNDLLQPWVEIDYNRRFHKEIRQSPRERYLTSKSVSRPSPTSQRIREAFRIHETRRIRRSDLTISLGGRRYEIPSAFRHLSAVRVAYARFDLSFVHVVDPRTGHPLVRIFPLDKSRNASGRRRVIKDSRAPEPRVSSTASITASLPPFLRRCVEQYQAMGLPPAFLHKNEATEEDSER